MHFHSQAILKNSKTHTHNLFTSYVSHYPEQNSYVSVEIGERYGENKKYLP